MQPDPPMPTLNDLLRLSGVDAGDTAVLFHVSDNPHLHAALGRLAADEPILFDAFQNQHGPNTEALLRKRRVVASFVPGTARDFVFAGLFAIRGSSYRSMAELDADPCHTALRERFGHLSFVALGEKTGRRGRLVFDLSPMAELASLVGRLIVGKPPGRAYARLAENLHAPVIEISRSKRLVPPPPEWQEFIVTGAELRHLPATWATRLSEWRGVYLILDPADGARYVGSAYGAENLHARWRTHVAGEEGVTLHLRDRDPAGFRFSILERLHPDFPAPEVIRAEQSWKARLHTVDFGLNAA